MSIFAYTPERKWMENPLVVLLSGLAAVLLSVVHIFASRFKFLRRTPRSRWLSLSGVVLNVLKEELPQERESRFWTFAAGAAGYTGLLLAL